MASLSNLFVSFHTKNRRIRPVSLPDIASCKKMSELLQQSTSASSLLSSTSTSGGDNENKSKFVKDPDFQQRPKLKGWMEDVVKRKLMEQLRHVHKNAGFLYIVWRQSWPTHVFKFGETDDLVTRLQSYRGHEYWPVECKHLILCTESSAVEREVKKQVDEEKTSIVEGSNEWVKVPFERLQSLLQQWLMKDDLLSEACGVPIFRKRAQCVERACRPISTTTSSIMSTSSSTSTPLLIVSAPLVPSIIPTQPENVQAPKLISLAEEKKNSNTKVDDLFGFNAIEFSGLSFLVKKLPQDCVTSAVAKFVKSNPYKPDVQETFRLDKLPERPRRESVPSIGVSSSTSTSTSTSTSSSSGSTSSNANASIVMNAAVVDNSDSEEEDSDYYDCMDSDDDELNLSPARLARQEKYRLKKQARLMRRRPYSRKLSIYDPLSGLNAPGSLGLLSGRARVVKVGSSPPRKRKMMTTAFEKPCEGVVFIANGGRWSAKQLSTGKVRSWAIKKWTDEGARAKAIEWHFS